MEHAFRCQLRRDLAIPLCLALLRSVIAWGQCFRCLSCPFYSTAAILCFALYMPFTRDTLSCCLIVNSAASSALDDFNTVTLVSGRHAEGSQHLGGSQEKSFSLRQYPLSYSTGFISFAWCSGWQGPDSFLHFGSTLDLRWNLNHLFGLGLAAKSSIPFSIMSFIGFSNSTPPTFLRPVTLAPQHMAPRHDQ